jgi:hypothetical protein
MPELMPINELDCASMTGARTPEYDQIGGAYPGDKTHWAAMLFTDSAGRQGLALVSADHFQPAAA